MPILLFLQDEIIKTKLLKTEFKDTTSLLWLTGVTRYDSETKLILDILIEIKVGNRLSVGVLKNQRRHLGNTDNKESKQLSSLMLGK